jgi:hypothetical protein
MDVHVPAGKLAFMHGRMRKDEPLILDDACQSGEMAQIWSGVGPVVGGVAGDEGAILILNGL